MKRIGLAATDPLQIIVSPLETVDTTSFWEWFEVYLGNEEVEMIIFGHPKHADGTDTYLNAEIGRLHQRISDKYPFIKIDYQDESFSSAEAKKVIIASGIGKKKRQNKLLLDKISAAIILQRYLGHI